MKNDKAITSVSSFTEELMRFSASNMDADSYGFSDSQGLKLASNCLKDAMLGLLPKLLSEKYRQAESVVVRTI